MTNFLISGIGADLGQSISKIIRTEFSDAKIIGIDSSDRHGGLFFCDELIRCPNAVDKNYIPFIENLLEQHSVDLFIPATEFELREIVKLDENHILWKKILSCPKKYLEIFLDKYSTFQFLEKSNIKMPWYTIDPGAIKQFPCIFKARNSSGSRNIFKLKNQEEAVFFKKMFPDSLFQELLKNDHLEYTCSVFRDSQKKTYVLQLVRKLTGGTTSWCQVEEHESIKKICTDIAEKIDLCGGINIQLRMNENSPMIFEINPRFSSTVLMRHLMGFKDLAWSVNDFFHLNNKNQYTQVAVGTTAIKVSETLLTQL